MVGSDSTLVARESGGEAGADDCWWCWKGLSSIDGFCGNGAGIWRTEGYDGPTVAGAGAMTLGCVGVDQGALFQLLYIH